MKPLSRTMRATPPAGFSLVEIIIALAVVSVGLIAVVGLIPQGVQSARDAADNTVSATLVHDIFSTIRTSPFTSATNVNSLGFNLPPVCNLQTFTSSASGVVESYFDKAGFIPAVTNADYYYKVVLTFQPELPATAIPGTTPSTVSMVTATVVWPALSASPINTNVFVTKVAQYYQ